jgi:MOSC domain-containing protein YiiM
MGTLVSVNVGMPRNVPWQGRNVYTGVFKDPVSGQRGVGRLNIEGDGQGDRAGHGGEQRAVFVYQLDSYRYWERELGRNDFVHGQFGENFTVEGLGDDEVCIGDRYHIGTATFEVTQPRVTCYRVGIRSVTVGLSSVGPPPALMRIQLLASATHVTSSFGSPEMTVLPPSTSV